MVTGVESNRIEPRRRLCKLLNLAWGCVQVTTTRTRSTLDMEERLGFVGLIAASTTSSKESLPHSDASRGIARTARPPHHRRERFAFDWSHVLNSDFGLVARHEFRLMIGPTPVLNSNFGVVPRRRALLGQSGKLTLVVGPLGTVAWQDSASYQSHLAGLPNR